MAYTVRHLKAPLGRFPSQRALGLEASKQLGHKVAVPITHHSSKYFKSQPRRAVYTFISSSC